MRAAEKRWNVALPTYRDLHASPSRTSSRSGNRWEFCDIRGSMGERIHEHPGRMPGARFFPDARLNFAENLLRRQDDDVVIVFSGEDQVRRRLRRSSAGRSPAPPPRSGGPASGPATASPPSSPTCRKRSSRCSERPRSAPWSSCSPDFGVQGVLDRFGQIAAHPPLGGRLLLWREDA